MTFEQKFQAYLANFRIGVRISLTDRADLFSTLLIYATLMVVFSAIFHIMPVEEMGRIDITRDHLLWYFAVTEIIVVSVQGNEREMGRIIAEGQLTTMMQRPGHMMSLWLARASGTVLMNATIISSFALFFISMLSNIALPMYLPHLPLFVVSIVMATMIFLMMGYMVSMLEIFGSYSRSASWMMSKIIFTFGGLFFPVLFFPDALRLIVNLTPAPAIVYIPGSFMLHPDMIWSGLLQQAVWVVIIVLGVSYVEKRMINRVLVCGD